MARDGGVKMEEEVLGDGDRVKRQGGVGTAFGKGKSDTPAKGALSRSGNGAQKAKSGEDAKYNDADSGDENDEDDDKLEKYDKEKDSEFWGVQGNSPSDKFLSHGKNISFHFEDSDSDEDVDLAEEAEKRRRAVERAKVEEEKNAEEEEEEKEERGEDGEKGKSKKAMSAPSGPPPGKGKKAMAPPGGPPPKRRNSKDLGTPTNQPIKKTGMTPDSNFVEDDWDEDSPEKRAGRRRDPLEDSTNSIEESPIARKRMNFARGEEKEEEKDNVVRADSNFATDDWD